MQTKTRLTATQHLLEAVMGLRPRRTRHFDQILHTLCEAGRDVIVELTWSHQGHRHLLRLKRLSGDRIYFSNPARPSFRSPGAILTDGLRRRVEPDGLESARLTDLRTLFETGKGEALLL